MKKALYGVFILILLLPMTSISFSADMSGKKVLYIDSYHEGYAWSDGITKGIQDAVSASGAELKIIRMDTKRNGSDEFKKKAALDAKNIIESYKPDVVIASDDNASKFLVMPYYKNSFIPVVFCGVNWDASVYGFPYKNVTGMEEVTPVPQLLEQLKLFAAGEKIGFLAPDILTARKEIENVKKKFGLDVTAYLAKDFEDWKKGFVELQQKVDMLIIDSDGGLYKENADEMKTFVEANTKKPTGSSYDFMAPYAMINFAKVAEEQGRWSGETALDILSGTAPSTVPIAQNKEGRLIVNVRIAGTLGIDIPFEILESASTVIE